MSSTIQGVGQIAIRTQDLPRAVSFYRNALGLEYLFDAGQMAFLMAGDVGLMLAVREGSEGDDNLHAIMSEVRPAAPR